MGAAKNAPKKPKKNKRHDPFCEIPYAALPWTMLDSKPWGRLSIHAVYVYVRLRRKYDGNNADNLSLTYKEIRIVMSKATFSRSILELAAYGFIKIIRRGRLLRECSIYGLYGKWRELDRMPERLQRIARLFGRLEKIKRIPARGNLKTQTQKRRLSRMLQYKILGT